MASTNQLAQASLPLALRNGNKCPDWLASQRPSSPEEQQSECIIWDAGQRVRLKESGSLMCPLPSV